MTDDIDINQSLIDGYQFGDGSVENQQTIQVKEMRTMSIDQTATKIADATTNTEDLERELRERSDAIDRHRQRFDTIRAELKRRREVKDEQPPMDVVTVESQRQYALDLERNLILKVTAMEAQQAQLVVEVEIAKAAQREAEERLALVTKHLSKREPMTRDAARELAGRHLRGASPDPDIGEPDNWVLDAVVEASK